MLQHIQLLHPMRIRKISHKVPLLPMQNKLLIIRQNIIREVRKQHQLLNNREIPHQILVLWENGLWKQEMQEDLSAPDFSPQEHGHEPRLGVERKVGLLHFMLDDTAVDVVKESLDDSRIAVWAIVIREIAQVAVEGVEEGMVMGFVQGETCPKSAIHIHCLRKKGESTSVQTTATPP